MKKVEMNEMIMVDAGKSFYFGENGKFGLDSGIFDFYIKRKSKGDYCFVCKVAGFGFEYDYENFGIIESKTQFLTPLGIAQGVFALIRSIF